MTDYFDTLPEEYENAELTCVIVHDRKTGIWYNLLTIIELIPVEQDTSPLIGQPTAGYCDRENVDTHFTV